MERAYIAQPAQKMVKIRPQSHYSVAFSEQYLLSSAERFLSRISVALPLPSAVRAPLFEYRIMKTIFHCKVFQRREEEPRLTIFRSLGRPFRNETETEDCYKE